MTRSERRAESAGLRNMMEREARMRQRMARSGDWPGWNVEPIPQGAIPSPGWAGHLEQVWENKLYAVLVRHFKDRDGLAMTHLAIRNFTGSEVPWRDKMRIKDEICGEERHAVEVFPARSKLIDAANMYHLFVYPEGYDPPFCLTE